MLSRGLAVLLLVACPAVTLAQRPSLRGIVRAVGDSGRRPVEGAEVSIAKAGAITDAQGRFRIDELPSGRLPIVIRRIGFRALRAVVEIYPDVPTEKEFFLRPEPYQLADVSVEVKRTGIYGVVLNPSSEPLPGSKIEVLGNGGSTLTADSAGRFALPNVHGPYLLRVSHPGYEEHRVSFQVESGRGRDVKVQLLPGRSGLPSHEMTQALFDLRHHLAFGLRREFLSGSDLARYGTLSVCDVPRIRAALGREQRGTLNGTIALLPGQICTWQANEVALVELKGGVVIWEQR